MAVAIQDSSRLALANAVGVFQLAALLSSFWLACFFYSVGYNLLMLQLSVLGPLICLGVAGPRRLAGLIERQPQLVSAMLLTVVVLCVHYSFFSISPEASYPFTWVMSALPLWALALGVVARPALVAGAIGSSVIAMAVVSDIRLLADGQRAFDPLADTNNYATLVYLIWIPLTHWILLRLWQAPTPATYVGLCLSSLVLTLAVFATVSRTGAAVVVCAMVAWSVWGIWHKKDLKPLILLLVTVLSSYGLFGVFAPDLQTAALVGDAVKSGIDVRWMMLSSAFQIAADNGINGSGLYTFSLLYPEYRSLGDQSTGGVLVHNDYVQLLVEGGVWLLIPVAALVLATAYGLLRSFHRSGGLTFAHGCQLAIAAALAHATLNFVLYSLVLCVVLGGLSFFAFRKSSEGGGSRLVLAAVGVWGLGLAFAAVSWFYLALDTYTFAVFSGQPSIPSAAQTRSDPSAALEYARFHARLNEDRSIPALGEALLLASRPYDDVNRDATLDAFRAAWRKHPWSVQTRLAMVDYIIRHRISSRHLARGEQPEEILLQALRDMPAEIDVVEALVGYYKLVGQPETALMHIRESVFPWIELMFRREPGSYDALGKLIEDLASKDSPVYAEYLELKALIDRVERDYQPDVWFMRWRRGASGG